MALISSRMFWPKFGVVRWSLEIFARQSPFFNIFWQWHEVWESNISFQHEFRTYMNRTVSDGAGTATCLFPSILHKKAADLNPQSMEDTSCCRTNLGLVLYESEHVVQIVKSSWNSFQNDARSKVSIHSSAMCSSITSIEGESMLVLTFILNRHYMLK